MSPWFNEDEMILYRSHPTDVHDDSIGKDPVGASQTILLITVDVDRVVVNDELTRLMDCLSD